ncbi:DUF6326 family protein [Haloferax sp. DFSO52]|uniref:DUF6326 family protein n=1 Tax=Haloferax sp. DFSO52 TaxID=3388505 RepID=UPI003A8706EB
MESSGNVGRRLEDTKIDIKLKLSALWISVLFLYIYVDIFSIYEPGTVEGILVGRVWEFEITPLWIMGSLLLMTVPILMVFLSVVLPARVNRWVNLVAAIVYIVVSLGNTLGESWMYLYVGAIVEAVLLGLIVWFSWKWPRIDHEDSSKQTEFVQMGDSDV